MVGSRYINGSMWIMPFKWLMLADPLKLKIILKRICLFIRFQEFLLILIFYNPLIHPLFILKFMVNLVNAMVLFKKRFPPLKYAYNLYTVCYHQLLIYWTVKMNFEGKYLKSINPIDIINSLRKNLWTMWRKFLMITNDFPKINPVLSSHVAE